VLTTCPRCSQANRGGRRFCADCGAALATNCLSCGFDNDPAATFCGGCGLTLLPALGAPTGTSSPQSWTPRHLSEKVLLSRGAMEGERKQLTVLFADLKGSMELIAGRDPEDSRRILDPVLECMMEAVHHYEGTVNQVMGDGIMALFGAPLAHEDHAVRACHAALRMQQATGRFAERQHLVEPGAIRIRVGLNSGEVIVRSIGSDLHMDYTAVGEATHLAARVEQAAEPGTVLISGATLALVEGYVDARPVEPRQVKGLADPIQLFEMTATTAIRSRFDAATARGLSPFTGRASELAELRRGLEQARDGRGNTIAIVGDAGVGKSRLFWEFANDSCTSGCKIVKCGAAAFGEATTHLHLAQLLESYFGLDPRDHELRIRETLQRELSAIDADLVGSLPALLNVFEIAAADEDWERLDAPQRRQRTLDAVSRLLLRRSRDQLVIVVFENLHWIDSEALALLDCMVSGIAEARVLLLVNHRPEFESTWKTKPGYRELSIDALASDSSRAMLDAMLGIDSSLAQLKTLLIERTAGNPLFLEESVKSLLDTGVLVGDTGRYRVQSSASTIRLPATVQAILAARIDRLAPESKRLLEAASVVGLSVPLDVLGAIAEGDDDVLADSLAALQTGQFLYQTSTLPSVEFTFKHALTQSVVYDSLLRERRRSLHLQALRAIERLHGSRLADLSENLAHHAVQAEDWELGARYLLESGRRKAARSAYREGLAYLQAGLDALARLPDAPERFDRELDVRVAMGSMQLATLGWAAPETERTYARAFELCGIVGATPRLFPVLWGIATFYLLGGHIDRAVDAARQFLAKALDGADDGPIVVGQFLMGNTLLWTGDLDRTRSHLEDSLSRYDVERHAGLARLYGQDIEVTALSYLAWTLWFQGHPGQAMATHDDAVRRALERNDVHSIAYAEGERLVGLQLRQEPEQLIEDADRAIAFAAERGAGFFVAVDSVLRAWAQARLEGTSEAISGLRSVIEAYHSTGAQLAGVAFRSMLADALLAVNDPESALRAVETALDLIDRSHDRLWEPEVWRLKGLCLLALSSDRREGEECLRKAVDIAAERGARSWQLRASTSLARWLHLGGRKDKAREVLSPALDFFSQGLDTPDVRDARALLSLIVEAA
jgi:class 3 adenylate cyclase/tetratricopeptide (TPR) repeat protein